MMRPFFPFYGSKWNIARYYPTPRYGRVIEPFAGSAGYSCFYGCSRVDLFDADPIVAGVWDFLLNTSVGEVSNLPNMPDAGDCVDNYSIPQEAKWLIGFCRGSMRSAQTSTLSIS